MDTATVEPNDTAPATADVQPTDTAPTPQDTHGLPPELLHTPAMQAIFAGNPPAVSASLKDKRPEFGIIAKNKDALLAAGIGLYRSLSGDTGVLFNQLYINGNDILAADKAGKLLSIAPPVDAVTQAVSKSGTANPVLARNAVPGAFAQPTAVEPPQSASGLMAVPAATAAPAQNSGLQSKILGARLNAAAPGAPTSGPAPGRGRLLNKILTPVV